MGCTGDMRTSDEENYIIAELEINGDNKETYVRILNSYEEKVRQFWISKKENESAYKNEDELKDSTITINNKKISFGYTYFFEKEGKYTIKYTFNHPITKADFMFSACRGFTKLDLTHFKTESITNMWGMFQDCVAKIIDVSQFNTQNVTNMASMFEACVNVEELDISKFDTKKVTDMNSMFTICQKLQYLDLSNFDTKNVTDMSQMFSGCESLQNLDLSSFNTEKVTSMESMFLCCKSLMHVEVGSFNTKNVKSFFTMFSNCESIKSIHLSNFTTENLEAATNMFSGCAKLSYIDLSNFHIKDANLVNIFLDCDKLIKSNIRTEDQKILDEFPERED